MKKTHLALLALALAAGSAPAQLDEVHYLNRTAGKETSVRGQVTQETPAGIRVKQRDAVVEVPAADILLIEYGVPNVAALEFRNPFGKESRALVPGEKKRDALLAEALGGFQELLPRAAGHARAKRYLQFKIAMVKAAQAETDELKQDGAVAALKSFCEENSDSWEIVAAVKALARILEARGDVAGAAKTYENLGKISGIPSGIKLESDVLVAGLLMRDRKYAEAEARLKALGGALPANDPQKPGILILLARAQLEQGNLGGVEPLIRSAMANTSDPSLCAQAHNALGDCFQKKGLPEDAFWEYLKVDVLYNQDRAEHAKALYFLAVLFDKVKNDPARARECKERLADKQFAGLEYARRAAGEK